MRPWRLRGAWFSRLLRHLARRRSGSILSPGTHTGYSSWSLAKYNSFTTNTSTTAHTKQLACSRRNKNLRHQSWQPSLVSLAVVLASYQQAHVASKQNRSATRAEKQHDYKKKIKKIQFFIWINFFYLNRSFMIFACWNICCIHSIKVIHWSAEKENICTPNTFILRQLL